MTEKEATKLSRPLQKLLEKQENT